MWVQRAREEHDAFVQKLRDKGVRVHLFGQLLAQALDQPGAREFLQDELTTATRFGPALDKPLDALVASAAAERLSEALIGGVLDGTSISQILRVCCSSTSSRTTSYCARCRTTCSSVTTRPGCTTDFGEPDEQDLHASARQSTRGSFGTSIRCFAMPTRQCTSITEMTP